MGKLGAMLGGVTGNLTNTGLSDPSTGHVTQNPNPQQVSHAFAQSAQPSMESTDNPGTFTPPAATPQAQFSQPSFLSALRSGPGGTPNAMSPALTTKGKLLSVLLSSAAGGAAGWAAGQRGNPREGYGGAAAGFQAGSELPWQQAGFRQQAEQGALQNQKIQAQLPFIGPQAAAELGKTVAGTQQAQAETKAIPAHTALEEAQTINMRYKEDPGSGSLIDLQTQQPVNGGQMIPVQTPEMANVLNVPVGTQVPLARAVKAADLLTKGSTTVQTAGGVYDYNRITGDKKRLGDNPREISLDTPVGALDKKTNEQVMVTKKDITANPGRYAPTSADTDTPVIKQMKKEYASTKPGTAGGSAIAFNTAIAHLGLLNDAIDNLGNTSSPAFNKISQMWKQQTGSPVGTSFDTIKQAVSGELAKATGSLSQGEQEAIKGPLEKANSPAQLKGAAQEAIRLMDGKMQALEFNRTNNNLGGKPLISPEAKAVRDRLLGGSQSQTKIYNGVPYAQQADGSWKKQAVQ